jgi:putative SOS response-associated peptidase YedK
MCNRFRVTAKQLELAQRYGVDPATLMPDPEPLPPPELFPKKAGWVVRNADGQLKLDVMEWGVPFNVKNSKTGKVTTKPVTNVRNLASGFWRNMLSNPANRCLVPVTEFAEPEGEVGSKVWRWFSLPSAPIFSFAGVWRSTEVGPAFAFLTCGYDGDPSTHIVGQVHPKACPVILHREDEEHWLNGDVDQVYSLASPFPSQLMKVA